MIDLVRKELADTSETWVVKIGSSVLTREDGSLDTECLACLAGQVNELRLHGKRVVLVSSGAIAAGLGAMDKHCRPEGLPELQAAAAVGQCNLMRAYEDLFQHYQTHAAQILLTVEDIENRTRYLNVRNTLRSLLESGMVPIVNENDTVSVDEICFGDNDRLAAMITHLISSPLLIMLTVVDGLYDGNPESDELLPISLIRDLNSTTFQLVQSMSSRHGRGGMKTKLEAAQIATSAGASAIIANGTHEEVLLEILRGEQVGTLVLAQGGALTAWKRWIGFSVRPQGFMILDEGAQRAVRDQGRSLLPAGIKEVVGDFNKGDVVGLKDIEGREFARGLSNYSSQATHRIRGLHSSQIRPVLEGHAYDEVIHRDNLVITV
jgi:glutamate 5-kinase